MDRRGTQTVDQRAADQGFLFLCQCNATQAESQQNAKAKTEFHAVLPVVDHLLANLPEIEVERPRELEKARTRITRIEY